MLQRLRQTTSGHPRPFWLLFWGTLINASGSSMVWPFLTIYLRQRLDIPLTTVALLLTANSAAGIAATTVTGPAVDRFGRKIAMLLSLGMSATVMLGMSTASTVGLWLVLMVAFGGFGRLYRVGVDAMVADLIPPDRRAGAYALLRMISNLGIAIGPSVGGFIAAASYQIAFYLAATANLIFAGLMLVSIRETAPSRADSFQPQAEAGYGPVLRDRPFLAFCSVYTLASMTYSLLMVLLPVYAKENFGVPENQYGFIMATNAAMVVVLQYSVTRRTTRHPQLPVLAVGSLFYALGVGSVAAGRSFPTFLGSMVILTIGELIMIPTSTALTANLAPPEMRGRYMGLYSLTWSVGFGIGPVLGGYLNDHVAPAAIWYFGLALGLGAAAGFLLLQSGLQRKSQATVTPP
ncbi:MAG: MFS transporter [Chloroflexota bacterium]